MEALDQIALASRSSMEAKEYWVHLDADGSLEKYPAKQHARRVQEKLRVDGGLIYLAGQPAKNNEDSDMPAPFRQRRYFYYLTGCNEPSCHMTYDIQHDTLSLFIPRIDPRRVIWNGRGSTLAEAVERYDIDEVYYIDELDNFINDWSNYYGGQGSDIYELHNGQLPRIPGLHTIIDSESLRPAMNAARMIKDTHEISLIRKANHISSEAHKKVLANILKFKNEAQVEGLFMDVCISHQAKEQAYDPIAASGPNAGTLHYDANNEDFEDRQLMCLDAGCEYELYASDITRTFPLAESWPSKEARNIYKLVERMQESCIERLAPGVRYLDLHILAHQVAIDGLLKLGILHNGTREEIYNAGTSRAFFPHGLGHHVGLEVHDVGQAELMSVRRGKAILEQAPSLFPENFHLPVHDPTLCYAPTDSQSSQLEEGMVITVEPGIYFSVYALQQFYLPSPVHSRFINQEVLRHYLPVGGVRIEDDILITSNGYENLTTAPKGDEMFEIIRGNTSGPNVLERTTICHPTGGSEPHLFRAPGVPLQTTPQPFRPINRTATMPCPLTHTNTGDLEHPRFSLGFRRSMTTDERIQHWRQSNQHSQPLEPTSPSHQNPVTVCGSLAPDLRHTFLGDACTFPFQARRLSQCPNCAILTQTLGRLRENLALSAQGSITQRTTESHTSTSPVRSLPLVHTSPSAPNTTVPAHVSANETQQAAVETAAQSRIVRTLGSPQQLNHCIALPGCQPQVGVSKASGERTTPSEVFDHALVQDLTKHCQNIILDQYVAEPACTTDTEVINAARAAKFQAYSKPGYATPQLPAAVTIIGGGKSHQWEQRRPSNHTDDRDWLS